MMTELWLSRAGLFIPLALAFVLFTLVLKWITIKKRRTIIIRIACASAYAENQNNKK